MTSHRLLLRNDTLQRHHFRNSTLQIPKRSRFLTIGPDREDQLSSSVLRGSNEGDHLVVGESGHVAAVDQHHLHIMKIRREDLNSNLGAKIARLIALVEPRIALLCTASGSDSRDDHGVVLVCAALRNGFSLQRVE